MIFIEVRNETVINVPSVLLFLHGNNSNAVLASLVSPPATKAMLLPNSGQKEITATRKNKGIDESTLKTNKQLSSIHEL